VAAHHVAQITGGYTGNMVTPGKAMYTETTPGGYQRQVRTGMLNVTVRYFDSFTKSRPSTELIKNTAILDACDGKGTCRIFHAVQCEAVESKRVVWGIRGKSLN
jgi:hypothetical protein